MEHADQKAGPETRNSRDLSRIALFVSILAVILVAIQFYAMKRNSSGFGDAYTRLEQAEERLEALDVQLRNSVAVLGNSMNTKAAGVQESLGERLVALEDDLRRVERDLDNPERMAGLARRALTIETLRQVAGQVDYLAKNAAGSAEAQALNRALQSLEEAQDALAQ